MADLLRFLDANEIWIYLLLGLVSLVYLRKFLLALHDWRSSLFGLERDISQRKLTEATSLLGLLVLMMGAEFYLVSFVTPTMPGFQMVPTPTLDMVSTATPVQTRAPTAVVRTPLPGATQSTPGITTSGTNCVAGQIELTSPKQGETVQGKVTLRGSVDIPNFGFYKYEYSQPGSSTWTTIQAGNRVVHGCPGAPCAEATETAEREDAIGLWDASQLTPGDYLLQLVVTDNQGQAMPACVIPVRVEPPPAAP